MSYGNTPTKDYVLTGLVNGKIYKTALFQPPIIGVSQLDFPINHVIGHVLSTSWFSMQATLKLGELLDFLYDTEWTVPEVAATGGEQLGARAIPLDSFQLGAIWSYRDLTKW